MVHRHPNGQKSTEGTFRDDELEGAFAGWYQNGQKQLKGTTREGKFDGVVTRWDAKGVKTVEKWRGGKCVSGCD